MIRPLRLLQPAEHNNDEQESNVIRSFCPLAAVCFFLPPPCPQVPPRLLSSSAPSAASSLLLQAFRKPLHFDVRHEHGRRDAGSSGAWRWVARRTAVG